MCKVASEAPLLKYTYRVYNIVSLSDNLDYCEAPSPPPGLGLEDAGFHLSRIVIDHLTVPLHAIRAAVAYTVDYNRSHSQSGN